MAYPWSANDILTATDLNAAIAALGGTGAWPTYTPQLGQNGNVTSSVQLAEYIKRGRSVRVNGFITATAAGSAGFQAQVSLPVAAATSLAVGSGYVYDASTTIRYVCTTRINAGVVQFMADGTFGANPWGAGPSLAIASGDQFVYSIEYQTAS